ncbi:MAG: flavodoxin [Anaerolineae bacterium]|nr:flavodoxin [Anaerolineae bacterium]
MKTLVTYDSVYGNTEIVARAIAAALPGEVEVQRVGQVQTSALETLGLLVIGSPTHGAMPTEAAQALVDRIGPPPREGARVATFDTRLTWPFLERWGGFAAPKMAEALEGKGWTVAGEPGGFFVRGLKKGPLKKGEVERASSWAKALVGNG